MTDAKAQPRAIELLAPARDVATAIDAIDHGADAVYIGGPSHGARAAAGNSVDDIRRLVEYARPFGVRIYVTLNTIIYDDELDDVKRLVDSLYDAGVDALIVQDMALLDMDTAPIQLHASTQADIRDGRRARFLQDAGFSQVVVARELSIDELREVCDAVEVPVEAFVHGALCVSYSGDCRAGWFASGRSANRGECPQMCRLRYNLEDAGENRLVEGKHLLSLRDLNRSRRVGEMLDAGVSSLKIEGRLKDRAYVKNAVGAYRRILDDIIAAHPDSYRRASFGSSTISFEPDLSKGFNRGFTEYFADGVGAAGPMASLDTPKMVGERAGVVTDVNGKRIKARLDVEVHNGDGMVYFNRAGELTGFRVNVAEGNRLLTAKPVDMARGTVIYRNSDKERDDMLASATASRRLSVDMTLRPVGTDRLALDMTDERGVGVTATVDCALEQARTPQAERHRRELERLGGSVYIAGTLDDRAAELFVPASVLADLRRRAVSLLDSAWRIRYRRPERRAASSRPPEADSRIGVEYNVANRVAAAFYRRHGAMTVEPAVETTGREHEGEVTVMETRYCVRRELGRCLKTPEGRAWKGPLWLTTDNSGLRYRLDFDCRRCMMRVVEPGRQLKRR